MAIGGLELLVDDPGELGEVGLRPDVVVDQDHGPVDELTLGVDQAGGELGAADDQSHYKGRGSACGVYREAAAPSRLFQAQPVHDHP